MNKEIKELDEEQKTSLLEENNRDKKIKVTRAQSYIYNPDEDKGCLPGLGPWESFGIFLTMWFLSCGFIMFAAWSKPVPRLVLYSLVPVTDFLGTFWLRTPLS